MITLFVSSASFADSPPPAPADWDLQSANRQYLAHGNLKANNITIKQVTDRGRILWSISPWQEPYGFELSDDGQSLARFFEVGIRPGLDQQVLTVIYRGKTGRIWYLRDFFNDPAPLPKSVSHMQWVKHSGWDKGVLVVATVDGRILRFDGTTGELRN